MIIDTHTHVGQFGKTKGRTIKELIASMDSSNVDISLVIASRFGDKKTDGDVSFGPDAEELISLTHGSERLRVIANIDHANFDEDQIGKLKKQMEEKLIVGVKLYLGYEHYFPYDKKLFPFYEICVENQIPVVFHTGNLLKNSRGLLKYCHPLTIDEVATRFPDLKIVIAHLGYPWIVDCAAVVEKNENVYMDLSGQFTELQSISLEDKELFWGRMNQLSKHTDLGKCIFGSDWWFYSQKECIDVVSQLSIPDDEKERIFWKNAKYIFNL